MSFYFNLDHMLKDVEELRVTSSNSVADLEGKYTLRMRACGHPSFVGSHFTLLRRKGVWVFNHEKLRGSKRGRDFRTPHHYTLGHDGFWRSDGGAQRFIKIEVTRKSGSATPSKAPPKKKSGRIVHVAKTKQQACSEEKAEPSPFVFKYQSPPSSRSATPQKGRQGQPKSSHFPTTPLSLSLTSQSEGSTPQKPQGQAKAEELTRKDEELLRHALAEELARKDEEITRLSAEQARNFDEIKRKDTELKGLHAALQAKDSELQALRNQLKGSSTELAGLRESAKRRDAELSRLQWGVQDRDQRLARRDIELNALRDELAKLKRSQRQTPPRSEASQHATVPQHFYPSPDGPKIPHHPSHQNTPPKVAQHPLTAQMQQATQNYHPSQIHTNQDTPQKASQQTPPQIQQTTLHYHPSPDGPKPLPFYPSAASNLKLPFYPSPDGPRSQTPPPQRHGLAPPRQNTPPPPQQRAKPNPHPLLHNLPPLPPPDGTNKLAPKPLPFYPSPDGPRSRPPQRHGPNKLTPPRQNTPPPPQQRAKSKPHPLLHNLPPLPPLPLDFEGSLRAEGEQL